MDAASATPAEFSFVLVSPQTDHPALDGGVVDVAAARCTLRVAARPGAEQQRAVVVRVLSEATQGRYAADARLEMKGGVGGESGAAGAPVLLRWAVPARLEIDDLELITTGLAQPDLVLAAGALAPGGGSYANPNPNPNPNPKGRPRGLRRLGRGAARPCAGHAHLPLRRV